MKTIEEQKSGSLPKSDCNVETKEESLEEKEQKREYVGRYNKKGKGVLNITPQRETIPLEEVWRNEQKKK